MAQSNIDIKIIAEFLGKSAFKQADTAANKLNKTVKSLGQSFGLAFGGAALGYAIKSTIKDFADAERETQQLSNTVKNLGLAFAAPEVEAYVQSIGKLYGVTGDQAVPAMQALLTATGSVSRSTKIMNVALDLAASRSADVASVAKDLASAYVGNTKGLNQYKLGLTKAELAALSFDEILEKIGSQTLGAADEAAKTLSGQLAILAEASNQAKERIGGGLVQALGGLAGKDGAGGAANTIENLSIKLTNAITGFGYLVQEVKIAQPILVGAGIAIGLAWAPWLTAIGVAALAIGAIGNAMRKSTPQAPMNTGKLFFPGAGDGGYAERLAAEKKAEAAAAARAKKLEQDAKAAAKAQKESLKLAKAKAIFDLQKIQIEAALKGKISEEDKIRLKLMQAIEEENLGNIKKYQELLTAAQLKTKELTDLLATVKALELKDPFGEWKIDPLTASINALTASMFAVQTQIQANGREWSSFANSVATTVIRPNLTEWSSSYSAASANAAAATAAANAALTATTTAASKAAADAAAASAAAITASNKTASEAAASAAAASAAAIAAANKTSSEANASAAAAAAASAAAIAAANKASAEAVAKAQAEALTTLGKLNAETAASTAAAAKAAQDAIDAANKTAAETVATILANASAAAAAKAAAAAAGNESTLEGFRQAEAAAATVTGSNATKIEVTVTGDPFTDPNAVAEKVVQIIREAGQRGTVDVFGID